MALSASEIHAPQRLGKRFGVNVDDRFEFMSLVKLQPFGLGEEERTEVVAKPEPKAQAELCRSGLSQFSDLWVKGARSVEPPPPCRYGPRT